MMQPVKEDLDAGSEHSKSSAVQNTRQNTKQQDAFVMQNQCSANQNAQTTVQMPQESIHEPPSFMLYSCLSFLLCCWPLGLMAIVKSSQVLRSNAKGDYDKATEHAAVAMKLIRYSVAFGLGIYIVIAIRYFILLSKASQ